MEYPLVSVITPAYNCENYIGQCIESVINQIYQNWEMVIVDDKSTDKTPSIIREYSLNEPRIKTFYQKQNMGAAAARNKAIEIAQGRFIAFLDSDDMWKPEKLSKQIPFMLENNYAFTFTSFEMMFQGNNKRKNKVIHIPEKIDYNQFLYNTIIGCLTVIMDKEKIGNIIMESGQLEDTLTWIKYLRSGIVAFGLNENLAIYRNLKGSVSNNKISNAIKQFRIYRKYLKLNLFQCVLFEIGYIINAIKKRLF